MQLTQQEQTDKAIAIALALGGAVKAFDDDRVYSGWFTIQIDDLHCINLAFDRWHNKGRIEVHGNYAGNVRDCLKYNEASPCITVSQDKTPEQIAKDIQRRFMPEYSALQVKCIERKQQHDEYAARRAARVDALCCLPGVSKCNDGDVRVTHGYIKYISGEVESGTVNMDLHSVPYNLIPDILRVLNQPF